MFGFINRVDRVFSSTMAFSRLDLKIGCGFEGIAKGYCYIPRLSLNKTSTVIG